MVLRNAFYAHELNPIKPYAMHWTQRFKALQQANLP